MSATTSMIITMVVIAGACWIGLPIAFLFGSVAAGMGGNVRLSADLARLAIWLSVPADKFLELLGRRGGSRDATPLQFGSIARELTAINLKELGKIQEAMDLNSVSLRMLEASGSKEQIAGAKIALARDYRDIGDFKTAEKLFEDAIPTLSDFYDEYRRESNPLFKQAASTLSNALMAKARLYELQRRFKQSELLWRTSISIIRAANGDADSSVIPMWCGLAVNLSEQGRFSEADTVIADTEKMVQSNPRLNQMTRIAASVSALRTKRLRGDVEGAERSWQQISSYASKLRGNYGLLGELLNEQALLRAAQGKHADAEGLFEQAIDNLEKRYSKQHPEVLEPIEGYAQLLERNGDSTKARNCRERAALIRAQFAIDNGH